MKMKRLFVDEGEEYPVFTLSPDERSWHTAIELSEEEYEQYLQAMDRYRHWQKRIKNMCEGRDL